MHGVGQVACLKVFEATHPGSTVDALNHPNQYFLDSLRHHEAKAAPAEVDDFTCARVRACVRACVYP
jgi:hypothetical protein